MFQAPLPIWRPFRQSHGNHLLQRSISAVSGQTGAAKDKDFHPILCFNPRPFTNKFDSPFNLIHSFTSRRRSDSRLCCCPRSRYSGVYRMLGGRVLAAIAARKRKMPAISKTTCKYHRSPAQLIELSHIGNYPTGVPQGV